MVGQEFKGSDKRDDFIVATPPLEALEALISLAASQKGSKVVKKLSFIDVSTAYFHAPAKRDLYIKLPMQALEPHEQGGHICG